MKNQDAKIVTRQYIDSLWDSLNLYPEISRVIQEYDSKVFNKRFYTAIQERIPSIHCFTDSYGRINVYKHYHYNCNSRHHNRDHHFIYMNKSALPENKRVIAADWLRDHKKNMITLYKEIQKAENALKQIDDIVAELDTISGRVNQLRDTVPYAMQDWFNCNYYLRRY